MIVWLQVLELPQASLALQVRVALKVRPHKGLVTVFTIRIATFVPSQMSNALGLENDQVVPHSNVWSVPHTIAGANVSRNPMVWLQVMELPQLSVALQVRTTVYFIGQ